MYKLLFLVLIEVWLPQRALSDPSDASLGDYPYTASLKINSHPYAKAYMHTCGGTILNEEWVLTAASCVDGGTTWETLEAVDVGYVYEFSNARQRIGVDRVVLHPHYNNTQPPSLHNIALIKLDGKITFNESANKIGLPDKGWVPQVARLDFLGWGLRSSLLQHNAVPLLSDKDCMDLIEEYVRDLNGKVPFESETMACTGPDFPDKFIITEGDTGGPLVADGIIYGVLSYRLDFNKRRMEKVPSGVFTEVAPYLSWIIENVGDVN
ncbi:unnamed protein product [Phyllotreta striolata]|uniref:Peptidase S1 domain-containing protein n=1 Tax=Phyllotreta striolata TaxID=444603 RepID=A0A9N9TS41_PHYSR|nr:unnamed protein product [Phyllotreta striolata]